MKANPYDASAAGCYVDGARGIYSTDAIVKFARSHGATIDECGIDCQPHAETCNESEFAGCEFAAEIENECSDYLNEYFPVDSHYWGRSEAGDWGLWLCEEN